MAQGSPTLPDGYPDLTLGWQVLAWCSKYLYQPDGDNAGDRWKFTQTQVRFVTWLYAVDDDGRFLYRRAALRWSKGAGKSPFAAALALAEFCGPVRFSHWEGEGATRTPIARGVSMPWVQIAATAESQTVNTMSMVTAMAPKGSRLVGEYGLDVGKERIYRPDSGRLEIITASAHAAEGARATFAIADETEWWLPSNGGSKLNAVIGRNLAKMSGRMLETCNAFVPGQDSVAEHTHKAFVDQQAGLTWKKDILYDAREAPADTNPIDEPSLRAGLAVAYEDAPWVDLDRIVAEYYDPAITPSEARRFYLNQIVAAEDAWVSPQEWGALEDTSQVVADGEPIVMFFDGSLSRDATALIGCRISDGHVFVLGVWQPDWKAKKTVPVVEVDAIVARAMERYEVVAFFGDVREWESFVKVSWPEKYGDKLLVHAAPSARDRQPIAWDMRSGTHTREFTQACDTVLDEILHKQFTHDGHPMLAMHVGNARRRTNNDGIAIYKESPDSPNKIDAAVAMVGARMVRRLVMSSKEWQKRLRRVTGSGKVVVYG